MQVEVKITGEFSDIFGKLLDLPKEQALELIERLYVIDKNSYINMNFKRKFYKFFGPNTITEVKAEVKKL